MTDDPPDDLSDEERNRANRLGRRRRGARSDPEQTGQTGQTGQTEQREQNEQKEHRSQTEQTTPRPEVRPVKERAHDTYYLREDLQRELRRLVDPTVTEAEVELDVDLETNRHVRPLLLLLGARRLHDLEPEEIAELLNKEDVLDSLEAGK